jgi:hypothetical protein
MNAGTDRTLTGNPIGRCLNFYSLLWVNDRLDRLNKSRPLISGSFSWTLQTLKYFKLSNLSASQFRIQITRVVETERHIFL